jgi:hypothetical protein
MRGLFRMILDVTGQGGRHESGTRFFRMIKNTRRGIHALPCLRYEQQQNKPMPASYPSMPTTIGEHIKKKRMDLKLLQSEVAVIFKVSSDCILIGKITVRVDKR